MINAIFSQFVEETPVTVMVRGIMERVFEPTALNKLFETHAVKQYTRELLFSNIVNLMSLVVSGIQPSVSAAYKALEKRTARAEETSAYRTEQERFGSITSCFI